MPDLSHSPASPSGSFPEDRSPTEVWDALCSLLDTEDPSQLVSRVLSVQRHVHGEADDHVLLAGTLSPLEETEAVLHRMRDHLRTLRTSNEQLVERIDVDDVPEVEDTRKQLEALIDLVDADSFEATMRQVESLQQQVDALYEEKERLVAAGFASADEALQEIDRLTDTCEALRGRLDASAQPITGNTNDAASPLDLNGDRPAAEPSSEHLFSERPPERHEASSSAGASTSPSPSVSDSDAPETRSDVPVEMLCDAIAHANRMFYDHLNEDNNTEARASLSDIPLDEQADQLRDYADQMSSMWKDIVEPAQTVVHEAKNTLGMTSIAGFDAIAEQAGELANLTTTLYKATAPHLPDLPSDAPPLPTGPATAQLRTSVSRLRSLTKAAQAPNAFATGSSGLDPEIGEILGVSNVQEAQEMMHIVQRMVEQLDQQKVKSQTQSDTLKSLFQQHVLVDVGGLARLGSLLGHDTLRTAPVAGHHAERAILHPLNEHLRELVDTGAHVLEHSEPASSKVQSGTLTTIPDVLNAFQKYTETLQHKLGPDATSTSEKLARVGISSVDDAIDMIESMSEQLSELYNAQEAMLSKEQGSNDGQSTFQQLEALYADQDKLQRELGVSDADSLISMVETMNAQLSDLYEERDHETVEASSTPTENEPAPEAPSDTQQVLPSKSKQVETRRDEKTTASNEEETLATLHRLEEKAEMLAAAVEHLQTRTQEQEEAIAKLEQMRPLPAASDDEPDAGPVPGPGSRANMSSNATSSGDNSGNEEPAPDSQSAPPSGLTNPGETSRFELSATAPVFDTDQLNALHTTEPSHWDDHSVGIIQLDDDGTVRYLNKAVCELPRLQDADPNELVGKNFFTDLALSTNNDLFRGRFEKGTECDAMQVCFPYTFIAPGYAPTVFNVHMHRHPKGSSNWILMETP